MTITNQVELTVEDRVLNESARLNVAEGKFSLIDLEAYGESYGDRGQATFKVAA